jgi:hypothetical protein
MVVPNFSFSQGTLQRKIYAGTVAGRIKTLKRKMEGVIRVGSGDKIIAVHQTLQSNAHSGFSKCHIHT